MVFGTKINAGRCLNAKPYDVLENILLDIEKTRKHFLEISPEDAEAINQLIKDVHMLSKMPMSIMDIKGVYFAGQHRMTPGGHPMLSGRNAVQMVCRQFNMEFI